MASLVSQLEQIKRFGWFSDGMAENSADPSRVTAYEWLNADDVLEVCRAWQAEQDWRDIASAPKDDGINILVSQDGHDIEFQFWDVRHEMWDNYTRTCSRAEWRRTRQPTHWFEIPIPVIPAPAATEE